MPEPSTPILFLITGSRGAGKTTFCGQLINAAREAGWQTAGILSLPVYQDTTRTAIQAEDLRSGNSRQLAIRREPPTPGVKHWQFDPDVVDWCNQVIAASAPTDLLVVDELGLLEFEAGTGFQSGFSAIDAQAYAVALVVVRAEVLGPALLRWPHADIIEIDTPEDSAHKAQVLARQLF